MDTIRCELCGHPALHCLCEEYRELLEDPRCDCGHAWSEHRCIQKHGQGEPCTECDCEDFMVTKDSREADAQMDWR